MNKLKQTKLGNIPSDWDVRYLGKIVEKERPISYGIVQTGEPVANGVKCVRVIDIIDGKIQPDNLITTSEKISSSYKRTLLKKGDLVIALRGKIGAIAIVEDNLVGANLTRGVALIALKQEYDSDFLKQQISSFKTIKTFEKSLNGSALKELSIGVIRKIPIIIPNSLPEQQKIAQILSTWDTAIEKQQQLIAKYELRKKGLMQKLLTPPQNGETHCVTGKEEWRKYLIEEVFETKKNYSFSRNQLSKNGNVKYIHYGDIHANFSTEILDVQKEVNIPYVIEEIERSNYFIFLKNGDVVFVDVSEDYEGVGRCIELKNIKNDKIISGLHTVALRDKSGLTVDGFRAYLFSHFSFRNALRKISTGASVLGISKSNLMKLPIKIPPKKFQYRISELLSLANNQIEAEQQQLEKLKDQKRGLMQVLLTGQKRVKIN